MSVVVGSRRALAAANQALLPAPDNESLLFADVCCDLI